MLLEEHYLWDFVEKVILELNDPVLLADHKKKMSKAKWVILDSMRDHLIPHIAGKTMEIFLFDALVTLYQSENIYRKMMLWN